MTPAPTPPSSDASSSRLARITLLMALVASLAACGGGGGGGDSSPSPPPPPPPPPPPSSAGPYTIAGTATYQSVPPNTSGSLNYNAQSDKPIRGATVQLLDASGNVLATTVTDTTTGAYSVVLPTSQAVTVRVRAEVKKTGSSTGDRNITVVDNTNGQALYTLDSTSFTPTSDVTQNLRAASGWGGSSYTAPRAAAPFAILDTIYSAQAKIATVSTANLPALKVNWSINNVPSGNSPATGQIGTTYFTSGGSAGPQIYVLGKENTDTDEFDTHVIAHEYGHYLQYALSRDDSVGGSHGSGDKLDLRVAFSEGWGNAWSGIALGGPRYTDSFGTAQSRGFVIDVSQQATGADQGEYSETTAQYLIWTSNATAGFGPIYTALTSLRSGPTFTTLYSFGTALVAGGFAGAPALWANQNVALNDAYGTGETNAGGTTGALPIYKTYATLGATQTYCVNPANDPSKDGNKFGEYVYVRFTTSTAASYTITATRNSATTATTDPDFQLVRSDGSTADANLDSTATQNETLTTTLPAGTHAIALTDYNFSVSNTAQACFDFKVQ